MLHIYGQRSALHVNPDVSASYPPQQSQHRDHGPGASAAGIGEILHTPLKCPLVKQVIAQDFVEIDIGALGESWVPPSFRKLRS